MNSVYPDDGSVQRPPRPAVKTTVFSREGHREAHLTGIRDQIERGEYRIDAAAVADAIMRRLRELAEARTVPQNECSYPDSGSSESTNTTPGSPSTIDPMTDSSSSEELAARIIAALRGKHTNNS
jgi:anti-sigma-28 factor FlgM